MYLTQISVKSRQVIREMDKSGLKSTLVQFKTRVKSFEETRHRSSHSSEVQTKSQVIQEKKSELNSK